MSWTRLSDGKIWLGHGDALELLKKFADQSMDAMVTDPPANISFMGKGWDSEQRRDDPGFGNWLAGFVDGEGCFRIHREKDGEYFACHFTIKLRRDDRRILEQICKFMGVGRVADLDVSPAEAEMRPGTNPQAHYIADTQLDCRRVREVFTAFPLRAKKAREFALWSEALDAWLAQARGNRWHGPSDKSAMESFWQRMKPLREYSVTPVEITGSQDSSFASHSISGAANTDWDRSGAKYIYWLTLAMKEALRVLKPGAHGLVWALPRTSHWTASALEMAGFEIRDRVTHLTGQGFPKGKQTQLKPAAEDWWLVRKPLEGSVAKNVEKYGTGALNIDASRIPAPDGLTSGGDCIGNSPLPMNAAAGKAEHRERSEEHPDGRWPANVALSHSEHCMQEIDLRGVEIGYECVPECPVKLLDEQSGISTSPSGPVAGTKSVGGIMNSSRGRRLSNSGHGDTGGASRFFYVAKPSRKKRGEGNSHPTVKSVDLMSWLVRLITPPGGIVLDPFMGSGSTGLAAHQEGCGFVGIEAEENYLAIARSRLEKATAPQRAPVSPSQEPAASTVPPVTGAAAQSPVPPENGFAIAAEHNAIMATEGLPAVIHETFGLNDDDPIPDAITADDALPEYYEEGPLP